MNYIAIALCIAPVIWLAVYFAYWKGRDDGVKAERERWTHSWQ